MTRASPTPPPASETTRRQASEMLFKGVTCALIGIVILLAPYYARSLSVRDLMGQIHVVGWFALVLGLAFMGRWGWQRWRGAPR
ncbi:hypothetical protein [Paracidovorax avenae]|uniref:hypothetical protein n=1 Tax=Paracidovorax avenae TaxID=80867 RepID=UPI000D16AEA6|nr:hypothetical protein [Paracidovorax avenae]AVS78193.1 hypothetical protein C8234_09035 [Paracidovorax avenae]AVS85392.1 hypothetical protein C8239_12025 [Paracidovorax avenae]AVS88892.1 hypothetical protein C8238_12140 [Paracidovorax avenae]AVS96238.1 hypothetical protein C8232_08220 [Paracidovorax avenae]AVT03074.1 hypothetical protein C8243_11670 [Paracidovorax avenae]